MSNQAIVNTSAFTNVTLRFANLVTPRGYQNQKETYSVTVYFNKTKNDALKKAGFKVKEPRINPLTKEKEYSMEIKGAPADPNNGRLTPHQPTIFNSKGEPIDPAEIGNGTIANVKVAVRDDLRNPGKLVTTLLAIKATEIIAPVSSITQDMIDSADKCDF